MSGSEWEKVVSSLRCNILSGNIDNLFADEYFVLDLLKVLYDDSVSVTVKIELLVILEQYSTSGAIQTGSIDHIIESLLKVFQHVQDHGSQTNLSSCILTTVTSLLIQYDQQKSDVCTQVKETLVNVVTTKSSMAESRRLTACACQCLITLEDWEPGILWRDKDVILKMMKQEMTDVYQDYVVLVTKIMEHAYCMNNVQEDKKDIADSNNHTEIKLDRLYSVDPQEFRQTVSMVMDNTALFTPCGMWQITLSLINLVQQFHEISPTIFKPLMLHHMATFNSPLLHMVLYLQREFEKEVLTDSEEKQLLERMVTGINHPCITPAQRLFFCHWTRHFSQVSEDSDRILPQYIADKHPFIFYPSVFDPLDCQLAKLCMFNLCFLPLTREPSDTAAALLLSSLGHLHKLVWHTGGDRPAVALFRALFHMYHRHCSKTFSQDINRFLRGLISGFPYFIPHALDFIEGLRETTPDSPVYLEILKLLHTQVVSTPEDQAAKYYHFYLQVLKRASLQKEITPQTTVKFLSYLAENSIMVDEGSWRLGNGILAVCQNLLICHGTENLYLDIGDLLFYMMTHYIDTDIQDRAMFYYTLLTSATDSKIRGLLKTMSGAQSFNQALSTLLPENQDKNRCSEVHDLDKPVLDWKRLEMKAVTNNKLEPSDKIIPQEQNRLEQYLESVQSSKYILDAVYKLSQLENPFQSIYAITIFTDTNENFEELRDINIASMSPSESQEVKIQICPRKPIPSSFHVWVEFVNDKTTYRCTLPDITVSLSDLMMPLNSDPNGELYNALWEKITTESKQKGSNCVQSIKILQMNLETFQNVIRDQLSSFQIKDSDSSAFLKFGMFLPPEYHLLLRCQEINGQIVVSIATDFYPVLPFVDQYLSSL